MPGSPTLADRTEVALARVTAALPDGEARPGQVTMARAVADAIDAGQHLVVQAGTGTGKSLAYLVPAVMSGKRVVVATATKALQDQLAHKDLPFLARHLDRPFSFSVLKGRSNYVCRQRLHEVRTDADQLTLAGITTRSLTEELGRLMAWAEVSATGDRAELAFEPSARAWSAVSVTSDECPGATRCPRGDQCFAESARQAAAAADIVVVNTHLYGLHLASGGTLLPPHDVVVIDEAHQLEDVISATGGFEISGGRFQHLARTARAILDDEELVADLETAGSRVSSALREWAGRRVRNGVRGELATAIAFARERAAKLVAALRTIDDDAPLDTGARKQRAMKAASALIDDLDLLPTLSGAQVVWVEGPDDGLVLRVAPLDVGPILAATMWNDTTAILTSATIAATLPERVGLGPDDHRMLDVGSPFDYASNGLLYCAAHLPDPRHASFDAAMHRELAALIRAAGGRTLGLFTSYRAMREAADALRGEVEFEILTQDDLPKPQLVARFTDNESTCLFATMGFWQGIDVPGRSLSLVTLDRLPFPRPDEPLVQARREAARADAFRLVDLHRAATLLAQGAGRLIRTSRDRGVVAVFDPRLANRASYRWQIIEALPPMRRTRDRAEVERFLREITA